MNIFNEVFVNHQNYIITSKYGKRVLNGVQGFHYGVDLVAKNDVNGYGVIDDIKAIHDGVITDVGYNVTSGYYVKYGYDNIEIFNCHFKTLPMVSKGQHIKKGYVFGTMGNTGHSTGAHLHFGVKVNSIYVNPMDFFKIVTPIEFVITNAPKLYKGVKCSAVKNLQSILNLKGYKLDIDGSYGGATERVIKDFQKSHGLTVDGVTGVQTWQALLKE